ncbi:MAG TPA: DUF1565 domain-containing protein [Thermoflexia bacterium]|nr:DUF1565 domain-containing protein [Thermoflexia bacterium]
MDGKRRLALGTAGGLALLVLGAVFLLLSTPAIAASATRYVATTGEDSSNDCLDSGAPCATIQRAVSQANAGDEIRVAQGVYTDLHVIGGITSVVRVDRDLTIRGGYTTTDWSVAHPLTQPTIIDAQGQGRGVVIIQDISTTLEGLRITNGAAFRGAGVQASAGAQVTISGCWVYNNRAERYSGGIHVYSGSLTLTNSYIYSNTAGWDGGGVNVSYSRGRLVGNSIYSNTAVLYNAGGVYLNYASHVILEDNHVYSNTASYFGGGVYLWTSNDVTMTGNYIHGNAAGHSGGGVYLTHSGDVSLAGNHVYSNTAQGGGGVYVNQSSDVTMTNNLVVENRLTSPSGWGTALSLYGSSVRLLHGTIAHNTGGLGGGIAVENNSTLWVTNTILVSHTVGITVAAGSTATLEATLWGSGAWANIADTGGDGTIVRTRDIRGDPDFVDPDGGDYHIGDFSAAAGAGVDAGVTTDIDGDPRPIPAGTPPDLGADEIHQHRVYLPLVMKRFP